MCVGMKKLQNRQDAKTVSSKEGRNYRMDGIVYQGRNYRIDE